MQNLDLALKATARHTCRIRVGEGALDALLEDLASELRGRRLVLIADRNVARLHGDALLARLVDHGASADLLDFPPGEAAKTRATKEQLEDGLFRLGADRDTVILAVGGGVTGDMAGFVAATWQRGVTLIHVPTTVLAMADAAVGGKTGLNLPGGKNLVGAFHRPWGVYADPALLATLDEPTYFEGFAEMVKTAVIGDGGFFRWLEASVEPLRQRRGEALEHAVATCVGIKSKVVTRDEREEGRRAVLNFGHTVGHGIEASTGYTLSHGRAIAIGMCVESRLATQDTGFPEDDVGRLERLLAGFGLPTAPPADLDVERAVEAVRHDKKNHDGRLFYAPPRRLGSMLPGNAVTVELDESTLRQALAPASGSPA